jgi:hypothetical protein
LASSVHWLTRPHIFSFLFIVIWLHLLEELRLGRSKAASQLPLVMLLWANFHGGFIFGLITWLAYAVGSLLERRRMVGPSMVGRIWIAGAASFLASLLTPGLAANWHALLGNASPYVLARTTETIPLDATTPGAWIFMGLVVLALVLLVRARHVWAASHALVIVGTAALALAMARNIPIFSIAAVPILSSWAVALIPPASRLRRLDAGIAAVDSGATGRSWPLAALVVATLFVWVRVAFLHQSAYSFSPQRFPVLAVHWAQDHHLQGRMFNELNWGGYLLQTMWPQQRVFIDSQSDFYGEAFVREYSGIMAASGKWRDGLDRYDVAWTIISPNSPLARQLSLEPAWILVYEDSTAVIFLHRSA